MDRETLVKITKHLALAAAKLDCPKTKATEKKIVHPAKKLEVRRLEVKLLEVRQLIPRKNPPHTGDASKIDFGKINRFVHDSKVRLIECSGHDKRIKIKRDGVIVSTNETLTSDEITWIIQQFSQQARVPITHMFRARVGNLAIHAFVSPTGGRRFMILKSF